MFIKYPPANTLFDLFKACVCYFFSNFYFFSIFIFLFFLSSFSSWGIQIFVFSSSPLFSRVSHCFRSWSKKNLKIYGVSNCLNENLITRFIWYLEKEIRCDIKTLSIDRELNKEHFLWKNHAENMHQKLAPDPFLILLNNPKQPLHARNSFKSKIFWKRIIKKPLKS